MGVAWTLFKGWAGWASIWQTAVTAVLVFMVLTGVFFIWHLMAAPARMERDLTEQYDREVRSLREENDKLRVRPYDKAKEQEVRDLLRQATDSDKRLLRFLLQRGEMEQGDIVVKGLDQNTTPDALLHCRQLTLIDLREDLAGGGIRSRRFRIRKEFEDVLKDLL